MKTCSMTEHKVSVVGMDMTVGNKAVDATVMVQRQRVQDHMWYARPGLRGLRLILYQTRESLSFSLRRSDRRKLETELICRTASPARASDRLPLSTYTLINL